MKTLLFIAVILLSAFISNAQSCLYSLQGHIEDADSKDKLAAATVLLVELNKEVITDSSGDFLFTDLCSGNYTIRVSHVGCATSETKIRITKSRHIDIDLPHLKNILEDVRVTSQGGITNTGVKKELSGRSLEEIKGSSLAEALGKMNGITILQTGSTVSKPVIHGLHSNRILTINNGVRQEGQQWGNEHAPEIDPFIANRLTVIKGVDELRYGSDAIGGVILVEPKLLRTLPGYNAELNSVYFTNNRQYVFSGLFEQQLKKLSSFTYRLQGTYKRGANSATPHYRLNNTGIEEKNYSVTAAWRKHFFYTELFYSYFNTDAALFKGSHIGSIPDLLNAISLDRPDPTFTGQNTYAIERPYQAVTHSLVKSKTTYQSAGHKFSLLLASQTNHRQEFDIIRNSASKTPQLDLSITTFSEDLNWEQPKKNNFSGIAGLNGVQQKNTYSGRYLIPAYHALAFGGYYIEKWNRSWWDAEAGVRYDYKTIHTNRLNANGVVFDTYAFDFSTLAASGNVGYKLGGRWKINSNIALANRAPQVNELLSNGIHHGTSTYEVGDINLKPERSVNISLNSDYSNKANNFSVQVSLYRNQINDFIYQQPKPDEPVQSLSGANPQFVYEQADALLQGIDVSTVVKPVKQISWALKYAMLRAKNRKINDWLIRMPADRIQNELTYNFAAKKRISNTYLSAEIVNVFRQTRVPDEKYGKQDYKDAPPAYMLLNMDAGTTITLGHLPLSVGISARNLLNYAYRDYLNSMRYFTDETGRNIQFRIKIPIEHFY